MKYYNISKNTNTVKHWLIIILNFAIQYINNDANTQKEHFRNRISIYRDTPQNTWSNANKEFA